VACLEAGADLNARHEVDWDSPDGGNTPLHFAARYSWDPAVFVVLIDAVFAPIWVWLGFGEVPGTLVFIGAVVILASVAGNALFGLFAFRRDTPTET